MPDRDLEAEIVAARATLDRLLIERVKRDAAKVLPTFLAQAVPTSDLFRGYAPHLGVILANYADGLGVIPKAIKGGLLQILGIPQRPTVCKYDTPRREGINPERRPMVTDQHCPADAAAGQVIERVVDVGAQGEGDLDRVDLDLGEPAACERAGDVVGVGLGEHAGPTAAVGQRPVGQKRRPWHGEPLVGDERLPRRDHPARRLQARTDDCPRFRHGGKSGVGCPACREVPRPCPSDAGGAGRAGARLRLVARPDRRRRQARTDAGSLTRPYTGVLIIRDESSRFGRPIGSPLQRWHCAG